MRSGKIFILITVLVGCAGPWEVENETLMDPPPAYEAWFTRVASCMRRGSTRLVADYDKIRWYSAVDIRNQGDGVRAWGLWTEPHKITIRGDQLGNPDVVMHEIIHDLLQSGSHEAGYFGTCDESVVRSAD